MLDKLIALLNLCDKKFPPLSPMAASSITVDGDRLVLTLWMSGLQRRLYFQTGDLEKPTEQLVDEIMAMQQAEKTARAAEETPKPEPENDIERQRKEISEILNVPIDQIHALSITPEQAKEILGDRFATSGASETPKEECKVVERTDGAVTLSGKPADPNWRSMGAPQPIDENTGQHKDYWVLSEEERSKGFVRPVRRTYIHLACGTNTSMSLAIAETYARDPKFYGSTFCCFCRAHFPLRDADGKAAFVWVDPYGLSTTEAVGS